MFDPARHRSIKDLKDLSVFFGLGYYRHAGPNGPEESLLPRVQSRAPVKKRAADRRARACPSPCLDREGNGFGRWAFFAHANDRGGQAPALRARKEFASPCAVRDQAITNYSLL